MSPMLRRLFSRVFARKPQAPPLMAFQYERPLSMEMVQSLRESFEALQRSGARVIVLPSSCEAAIYQLVDGEWKLLPESDSHLDLTSPADATQS